jgi:ABC-type oligopeptide transport system ATPase subunit
MDNYPRIAPGQRATLVGRSGSGKSTLGRWLLVRSPGHWIILNPKHTSAYDGLPDSIKLNDLNLEKLVKAMQEHRFVILNPKPTQCTPEIMDAFVDWLHLNFTNIGLCCDELYTLHFNGRAGPGLTGWLTRGRELKQSFLGMTQRPAWISKFLLSESNFIGEMSLNQREDRKVIYDIVGDKNTLEKLAPFKWLWYSVDADKLMLYGPVPES